MSGVVVSDGHLAWPLFSAIVFTALLLVLADFAWRQIQRPARQIAAVVLAAWLLGLLVIFLL